MHNYEFLCPTKIFFGKDTHKEVGEKIKPYAKKVLLHYGGGSIKNNGVYDDVVESLNAAGIEFVELSEFNLTQNLNSYILELSFVKKITLNLSLQLVEAVLLTLQRQ